MPDPTLALYFENNAGQIWEHPDGYAFVCYHANKRQPGELERLIMRTGALLLTRGWQRVLGDQRLMKPQSEEEKAWILEQWYGGKVARPTHILAALVLAKDVFTRLATQQIISSSDRGYLYESFTDLERACARLLMWPA